MSIGQLADAAVALVGDRRRVVLGIAGAPGAGKSTLADALVGAVAAREGSSWVARGGYCRGGAVSTSRRNWPVAIQWCTTRRLTPRRWAMAVFDRPSSRRC